MWTRPKGIREQRTALGFLQRWTETESRRTGAAASSVDVAFADDSVHGKCRVCGECASEEYTAVLRGKPGERLVRLDRAEIRQQTGRVNDANGVAMSGGQVCVEWVRMALVNRFSTHLVHA